MTLSGKLKQELKSLGLAFLYFSVWIGTLVLIKKLVLEEYDIEFKGLSLALIGALILSKVVLLMEPIPLGRWMEKKPAWVGILLRTALYTFGAFMVMLLEKVLEQRQACGGLREAFSALLRHAGFYHVLANTICLSGALLGFNILAVLRERLGATAFVRLFTTPMA